MKLAPTAVTAFMAIASLGAAEVPKRSDNCTPPPSAIAPTLPPKLLPGMGTVHLVISTSSPKRKRSSIRAWPKCIPFGRARPNAHSCNPRRSTRKRRCRSGVSQWWRPAVWAPSRRNAAVCAVCFVCTAPAQRTMAIAARKNAVAPMAVPIPSLDKRVSRCSGPMSSGGAVQRSGKEMLESTYASSEAAWQTIKAEEKRGGSA